MKDIISAILACALASGSDDNFTSIAQRRSSKKRSLSK